jgi:VWFA-related protein
VTLIMLRLATALMLSLVCPFLLFAQEQSNSGERPRLKEFGSSLKKLKWDKKKKTTIDATGKRKSNTDDDEIIRIETDLVATDVAVLDQKRRVVGDLKKEDFIISEDDVPQEVAHFSLRSDQDFGRTFVLIIDYSSSMTPFIKLTINAAKRLLDQLGPKDRMAIVTDDVELLVDFTSDKNTLRKALDWLAETSKHKVGRTMQISALLAAIRELLSPEDIRPVIIFQTDVDQINSLQPPWDNIPVARHQPYNFDFVLSEAEKSGATIYSIVPGIRYLGIPRDEQLKRSEVDMRLSYPKKPVPLFGHDKELRKWVEKRVAQQQSAEALAKSTGGWTRFLEQPGQADEIYSEILYDLNNRYIVGYYPTNKTRDGSRRKIQISVKDHPEYIIWGRNSYRAGVE